MTYKCGLFGFHLFVFTVCVWMCTHALVYKICTCHSVHVVVKALRPIKEKTPSGQETRACGLARNITFQLGHVSYLVKSCPPLHPPRITVSQAKEIDRMIISLMSYCTFPSQISNSHCSSYGPSPWGSSNLLGPKREKCNFPFLIFLSLPFGREAKCAFSNPLDFFLLSLNLPLPTRACFSRTCLTSVLV